MAAVQPVGAFPRNHDPHLYGHSEVVLVQCTVCMNISLVAREEADKEKELLLGSGNVGF